MRPTLDQLANVALIVACAAVTATVAAKYQDTRSQRSQQLKYEIGEKIEKGSPIDYRLSNRTLVLFVRSGCRYCDESMPFYRALLRDRKDATSLRIVVATAEPPDAARAYLDRNGLTVDDITQVHPGEMKANATPTIVVIDSTGAVKGFWRGKLSESNETEVRTVSGI